MHVQDFSEVYLNAQVSQIQTTKTTLNFFRATSIQFFLFEGFEGLYQPEFFIWENMHSKISHLIKLVHTSKQAGVCRGCTFSFFYGMENFISLLTRYLSYLVTLSCLQKSTPNSPPPKGTHFKQLYWWPIYTCKGKHLTYEKICWILYSNSIPWNSISHFG